MTKTRSYFGATGQERELRGLLNRVIAIHESMAVGQAATVKLSRDTLRVLNVFKRKGGKLDEVLLDWLEEHDPQAFIEELHRRTRNAQGIPWRDACKNLG